MSRGLLANFSAGLYVIETTIDSQQRKELG